MRYIFSTLLLLLAISAFAQRQTKTDILKVLKSAEVQTMESYPVKVFHPTSLDTGIVMYVDATGLGAILRLADVTSTGVVFDSQGSLRLQANDATIELDTAAWMRLPQRTTDPTGSAEGRVYYSTVEDCIRFYDGSSWACVGTGGSGATLQSASLDTENRQLDITDSQGTVSASTQFLQFSVPHRDSILTDNFPLNALITDEATGAVFKIQSDTISGYVTDSIAVIPTGSNYAVYQAVNGVNPFHWGLAADGVTNDAPLVNKAFRYANAIKSRFVNFLSNNGGEKNIFLADSIDLTGTDTVRLFYGAEYFEIRGNGNRLTTNGHIIFYDFPDLINDNQMTKVQIHGFRFHGSNNPNSVGIRLSSTYHAEVYDNTFYRLGRGVDLIFVLKANVHTNRFTQNYDKDIYLTSGGDWGAITGYPSVGAAASAVNANIIRDNRMFCRAGQNHSIYIKHGDTNKLISNIIEGANPDTAIYIDASLSVNNANYIDDLHFEHAIPGDTTISIYLNNAKYTRIKDMQQSARDTFLIVDNQNSVFTIDIINPHIFNSVPQFVKSVGSYGFTNYRVYPDEGKAAAWKQPETWGVTGFIPENITVFDATGRFKKNTILDLDPGEGFSITARASIPTQISEYKFGRELSFTTESGLMEILAGGNNRGMILETGGDNSPLILKTNQSSNTSTVKIQRGSSVLADFTYQGVKLNQYGQGNQEASDLSKSLSSYLLGMTQDGFVVDVHIDSLFLSPDLTGVPTAPTATVGDSSTQVATTAFVLANQDGAGTDDQTATEVPFTPTGNIAATDVQAAIEELDTKKANTTHTHTESDITDLSHFTGADITGAETAFDGWDKDASDDIIPDSLQELSKIVDDKLLDTLDYGMQLYLPGNAQHDLQTVSAFVAQTATDTIRIQYNFLYAANGTVAHTDTLVLAGSTHRAELDVSGVANLQGIGSTIVEIDVIQDPNGANSATGLAVGLTYYIEEL